MNTASNSPYVPEFALYIPTSTGVSPTIFLDLPIWAHGDHHRSPILVREQFGAGWAIVDGVVGGAAG
ncbi:hypothetical protein DAEQUDRAFT_723965 [Daedalea quercina L-15889]|uniref:Uncharacterized protein n=1 Tax=Daedalea quercina L-15889 TaxID=1314783 RepID=A0A165S2M2_9APHY|nr:hypothetical protein DAEQUDRAFT_723965 [Daedalea quercina L-15889]